MITAGSAESERNALNDTHNTRLPTSPLVGRAGERSFRTKRILFQPFSVFEAENKAGTVGFGRTSTFVF